MENNDSIELQSNSKRARIEVDLANLAAEPCLRKKNSNYHPNDRDKIRRAYLQKKKPCQPFEHNFPHVILHIAGGTCVLFRKGCLWTYGAEVCVLFT
jgi:hypothetical protein